MEDERRHNPGEPKFGEGHGGEHNPGEPTFGEQEQGGDDLEGQGGEHGAADDVADAAEGHS